MSGPGVKTCAGALDGAVGLFPLYRQKRTFQIVILVIAQARGGAKLLAVDRYHLSRGSDQRFLRRHSAPRDGPRGAFSWLTRLCDNKVSWRTTAKQTPPGMDRRG